MQVAICRVAFWLTALVVLGSLLADRTHLTPAVAAPAPAGPSMLRVVVEKKIPSGFLVAAKAYAVCPKNYGLISGGVDIEDYASPHIAQSYPDLEKHRWGGAAVQPGPSATAPTPPEANLVVYAICAKSGVPLEPLGPKADGRRADASVGATHAPSPSLVSVAETVSVRGKFFAIAKEDAACPVGWSLISGGAAIFNAYPRLLQNGPASRSPRRIWEAAAVQPPFESGAVKPDETTMTVSAVCSRSGKPVVPLKNPGGGAPQPGTKSGTEPLLASGGTPTTITIVSKTIALDNEFGALAQNILRCPRGLGLISGGASLYRSAYPHLVWSSPDLTLRRWEALASQPAHGNVRKPDAAELTVTVLCAKSAEPVVSGAG